MKLLITILMFFMFGYSYAQESWVKMKADTFVYAFNSEWELIEPHAAATYYRKAWAFDDELFYVFDYYRGGRIQMKSTARNHDPLFDQDFVSTKITYNKKGDTLLYERYNDTSALEGVSRRFYESGQLEAHGNHLNNVKNGPWRFFHENGQLSQAGNYYKGDKQGAWEFYFENGALKSKGDYVEGNEKGEWRYYFDNGVLEKKVEYINGNAQGEVIIFTKDSTVRIIEHFDVNGKKHGSYERFDSNGKLEYRTNYKHGEEDRNKDFFDINANNGWIEDVEEPEIVIQNPEMSFQKVRQLLENDLKATKEGWAKDRAVLYFEISEKGQLDSFQVMETCNDIIDTCLINALENTSWKAGTINNLPVRMANEMIVICNYGSIEEIIVGKPFVKKPIKKTISGYNGGIFHIVEEQPEFEGGISELYGFIGENISYPRVAKESGISGVVYVQFVVGKSGVVRNPRIIRSIHPALDHEAMRIVKMMPAWNPGRQRGKVVPVYYNLPFRFKLT